MAKKRLSKAAKSAISRANKRPSITALLSLGILAIPAAEVLLSKDSNERKILRLRIKYTGFDPRDNKFKLREVFNTYAPAAVPLATKKVATKLGLLRGVFRGMPVKA